MRSKAFQMIGAAALGTALLAAVSGCAGDGESADSQRSGSGDSVAVRPSAAGPSAGPASAGSTAPASAPALLRFKGTTLDGKGFDGTSLAGRPVVFWFWAPWCPKCAAEGPAVAGVAQRYEGKVAFVGIAGLDKSRDQMKKFVSRTGTGGITQLDDGTGRLYSHFKVTAQSSYVFMTADGEVSRDSGPLDERDLAARVDRLTG